MPHIIVNGTPRHLHANRPKSRPLHHRAVGALAPGEVPPVAPPKADASRDLPFYDQEQIGSCTANSTLRMWRYLFARLGLAIPDLARLFLYWAERVLIEGKLPSEDDGAENSDAIKACITVGVCNEEDWPYDTSKVGVTPPQDVQAKAKQNLILLEWELVTTRAIKLNIAGGFPCTIAVPVTKSVEDGTTGAVFPVPTDSDPIVGWHSILLVAYDDETGAFIFDNSWGKGWGNGGRGVLPYGHFPKDQDALLATNLNGAQDSWAAHSATGI